jgi:hypothetical protein
MKYKIPKNKYYMLRDMSRSLEYGKIKLDKRIQVKMPSFVVEKLDSMFPNTDRSTLLTKLALEAILNGAYIDNQPNDGWATFVDMEEAASEDMLNYLEEREKSDE